VALSQAEEMEDQLRKCNAPVQVQQKPVLLEAQRGDHARTFKEFEQQNERKGEPLPRTATGEAGVIWYCMLKNVSPNSACLPACLPQHD
jgi:hypothetical protein